MSHVMIRLNLEDYAKWRSVFDEVAHLRESSGSHGGTLYRSADDPHEVVIVWDWPDLAKARSYFQSDALRQAMQRAGVQGRPEIVYLDAGEKIAV